MIDPKTGISDNQPNTECLDCSFSMQADIWRCNHLGHERHGIALQCPTDGKPCGDYDPETLAGMVRKANRN